MLFGKLFALQEHAGRAVARIVDLPLVRREQLDQHADHAAPSVVESFKHRCVSGVFGRFAEAVGLDGSVGSLAESRTA